MVTVQSGLLPISSAGNPCDALEGVMKQSVCNVTTGKPWRERTGILLAVVVLLFLP